MLISQAVDGRQRRRDAKGRMMTDARGDWAKLW